MQQNFLRGCVKNSCPENDDNRIVLPAPGETLAPFVIVTFDSVDEKGRPFVITVGNNSSLSTNPPNVASISTFEYGTSNGFMFNIEIVDQEEGTFTKFLDQLHKCVRKAGIKVAAHVQWGWLGETCKREKIRLPSSDSKSAQSFPVINGITGIRGVPIQLDVSIQGGLVKALIKITGTETFVFHQREKVDLKKMSIRNSLVELFKPSSGCEPQMNIAFLSRNSNARNRKIENFFASIGDKKKKGGRRGNDEWAFERDFEFARVAENKNRIEIAKEWIEDYVTEKKLGVTMQSDATHGNVIIFWEDLAEEEKNKPKCNKNHIGTFIVNGGPASPVLEFTPKINWPDAWAALSVGGTTGGVASGKGKEKAVKQKGSQRVSDKNGKCCNTEVTGTTQGIPLSNQAVGTYAGDEATEKVDEAQKAHQKAEFWRGRPIEAELRLQGQAGLKWADVKQITSKFISIVFINPFYLKGSGCGDWLAQPACNEVLTNRNWRIQSLNHMIKEGSWTTTLKIILQPPGAGELDPEKTRKLGGDEKSPYVPKGLCERRKKNDTCA